MRKHFKLVIVALIVASGLACFAIIVVGVNRYAWTLNAERNIHGAGVIVQIYKSDNGVGPKSLKEAFDWVDSSFKTNVVNLGGCPNSHYEYQVASNRFSIAIVREPTWFHSEWKVEQKFEFDTPTKAPHGP